MACPRFVILALLALNAATVVQSATFLRRSGPRDAENASAAAGCAHVGNVFTGGTCNAVPCNMSLGPTDCTGTAEGVKVCTCRLGFCFSKDAGKCVLDTYLYPGTLRAKVVPLNAKMAVFPPHHNHVQTALCFSGGGTRSMTMVMGQLRALHSLGITANINAISAVSGASWATSVYMFARTDETSLLGSPTRPSELSMKVLRQTPPALGNTMVQGSILEKTTVSAAHGSPGPRIWQDSIAHKILHPFGLDSNDAFMAADHSAIEAIKAKNPQLAGHKFLTPLKGRPKVFVMNGIFLNPAGEKGAGSETNGSAVSFQMSPDYSGSPFYPNGKDSRLSYSKTKNLIVGGGLHETFVTGSAAPSKQGGGAHIEVPSPELPFTLGDAIGISSAIFAKDVAKTVAWTTAPQLQYWPVTPEGQSQPAIKFEMGDGALMDDTGLLAMLQRGARKIAWFVNAPHRIAPRSVKDFCKVRRGTTLSAKDFENKIAIDVWEKFVPGSSTNNRDVVFEDTLLAPYVCELQKLKEAGKPAVLRKTFKVKPNSWWGITGGYDADILLVLNSECKDFMKLLPADTKDEVNKGKRGGFEHYPFFKTMFQNKDKLLELTAQQVNLLAAQAEYIVLQNQKTFKDLLA